MHFLFLSSLDASQYHPDNTPEDFTVTLPNLTDLKGECPVGDNRADDPGQSQVRV